MPAVGDVGLTTNDPKRPFGALLIEAELEKSGSDSDGFIRFVSHDDDEHDEQDEQDMLEIPEVDAVVDAVVDAADVPPSPPFSPLAVDEVLTWAVDLSPQIRLSFPVNKQKINQSPSLRLSLSSQGNDIIYSFLYSR